VRRRLFLQIYFGFLAIALVFTAATFAFAHLERRDDVPPPIVSALGRRFAEALPQPGAPSGELQAALDALAAEWGVDATLWGPTGEILAAVGEPSGHPPLGPTRGKAVRLGRRGVSLPLPDGRLLGIHPRFRPRRPGGLLTGLLLLNAAIAAVAYPVSRRMARRLERLRTAVDELGSGGLATRVPVEGRDEIADVARSFNRAAERIEALVNAQRRVLASASHELRTPLTRLRMALALLGRTGEEELLASAERDVEELDALIGDVLTAAHLEGTPVASRSERVELLDLVADEATRLQASVSGEPVAVRGDPKLLRRLVRNLVDNAVRHAGGEVEVSVARLPEAEGACLRVADRGPGIPEGERLRIFEPFYRPSGHSEGRDGGVGLGLALVAEIARHHGGDAVCRSRPGGGTIFEVILRHPPNSL